MALTERIQTGVDEQVIVEQESGTYPASTTPTATGAVPHVSVSITDDQERAVREDLRHTYSMQGRSSRHRNIECMLEMYQLGGGSTDGTPDDNDILDSMFTITSTTATTVKTASTARSFDVTTPANLAEYSFVSMADPTTGLYWVRWISDITGDTTTLNCDLPWTPAAGENIYACRNFALVNQPNKSCSLFSKGTDICRWAKGWVPSKVDFVLDGSNEARQTITGPASDSGMVCADELAWPMLADYGFSQAGPTGDPTQIDATHKTFKLSARNKTTGVMDAAEDCTLTGAETTWTAVVAALNGGIIGGLTGTTNKTCVAVEIGTNEGMYIRHAATGSGGDVLLTAGSANSCDVILELGETNGGYELDADEMKVDSIDKFMVDGYIYIGSEGLKVTALDRTNSIVTATRAVVGSAAAHAIDDDVDPYWPSSFTLTDVQPIAGITGGVYVNQTGSSIFEATAFTISIDNKAKVFNEQFGRTTGNYFRRVSMREVTVSLTFYVTNENAAIYNKLREFESVTFMGQAGNSAGSIRGYYVPELEMNLPAVDLGPDEGVTITVDGVAIAQGIAGGDEFYMCTS